MASPSYWWTFGHETDQTLQNKQELVIRSCSRVSSGAEVIIDAFETKRPISDRDFQSIQKQGHLMAQFPVPDYSQQESMKHLTENIPRLFESFTVIGYESYAVEVDSFKTWPIEQFCKAVFTGFLDYIYKRKNPPSVKVSICTKTESNCKELCKLCSDILMEKNVNEFSFRQINEPFIDERFVNIEVLQGDICQIEADVIVNTTSPELDLTKGKASYALLKAAGTDMQKALYKHYKCRLEYGQIAVTKGHNLPCKYVLHGFLERYDENTCSGYQSIDEFYKASVHDFMTSCIQKAVQYQCASISFPVIGTGTLYYPPYLVAEEMFETVENLPPSWGIEKVKIVIYGEDDEVLKMFQKLEQEYAQRHSRGSSCMHNGQSEKEDSFKVIADGDDSDDDEEEQKEEEEDDDDDDKKEEVKEEEEEQEKGKGSPKVITGQSVNDISSSGETRKERSFTGKSAARSLSNLNVNKKCHSQVETDLVTSVTQSSPSITNNTEDGKTKMVKDSAKFTGDRRSKESTTQTDLLDMSVTLTKGEREVKFGGSQKVLPTSDKHLIVKVSKQEYNLFEHFGSELIEKYKKKGCLLSFEVGNIVLYGEIAQCLPAVKIDVLNAIKKTWELKTEKMDVCTYDKVKVKRYAAELTTKDVLCIVDSDVFEIKVFSDSSDKLTQTIKEFKNKLNETSYFDQNGGQHSHTAAASTAMERNKLSGKEHLESPKRPEKSSVRPSESEKPSLKDSEDVDTRPKVPKPSEQQPPKVTETGGARPKTVQQQFSWSSCAKHLEVFYLENKLEIRVYQANILNLPVQCIVNAANKSLVHGGGIAKVIAEAAGPDLDREGCNYVKRYGRLGISEVCSTTAGKLHYECVLHTVGPDWNDYKPHGKRDIKKCESDLHLAVLNSLWKAEHLGLKSIAIPGISSGLFGCPKELCCMQYCKAVIEYGSTSVRDKMVQEIHFVDMNAEIVKQIKYTFKEMIHNKYSVPDWYDINHFVATADSSSKGGYKKQPAAKQNTSNKIDGSVNIPTQPQSVLSRRKGNISQEQGKQSQSSERYVPESKSLERRDSQSQSRKPSQNNAYPYTSYKAPPGCVAGEFECVLSPKHMLYVYTVEITQKLTDVDMIACGETEGGDSTGKVTKAIESMFGEKFIQEKKLKFKKAKEGDIVIVRTGQNVIEYVAHVILYQKINTASESDRKEKMSELYKKLFVKMKDKKCRGVALPVLGTGKGNLGIPYGTERLLDGLQKFASHEKYGLTVHLINRDPEKTKKSIETIQSLIEKPKQRKHSPQPKGFNRSPKAPNVPSRPKFRNSGQTPPVHGVQQKEHSPMNKKSQSNQKAYEDPIPGTDGTNRYKDLAKPSTPCKDKSNAMDTGSASGEEEDNLDDYDSISNEDEYELSDSSVEESKRRQADPDGDDDVDDCVICMEKMKNPTRLVCGHEFCRNCIEEQFTYKEVCPVCGRVCGLITGNQPEGTMSVKTNKNESCAGFERFARLEITYKFPDGKQGTDHPDPGKSYKGITRVAYLPDNNEGRLIKRLLQIAFDRKLVFTIGSSRTTGEEGVITWNDIHHKTDPRPNTQFGYPDPGYLDRVLDELAVKGVTEKDLNTG